MGSNDTPPPHVASHVVPVYNALLQVGGGLWTICYILLLRQSIKDRSYGMPLFSLALNVSWEAVYALTVAEMPLEQAVFGLWLVIDLGMIYTMMNYGKKEWDHAPLVARNLGTIFVALTVYALVGHWAFAKWWLENDVGKKDGKFYRGVVGPDTTELGFWSAGMTQVYLSAASLAQLLIRQHSRGVSWSIWAVRMLGSVIGLYLNYGWAWYFWREAHEYFMSPFGVFIWGSGLVLDLAYAIIFWKVKTTEEVFSDIRKIQGGGESKKYR